MSSFPDERRQTPRFEVKLEAKVVFTASPQATSAMVRTIGPGLTLIGSTHDVSEPGVGLLVSARNIDRYLTSEEVNMDVEVRLPSGLIRFAAKPVHHQRLVVDNASVGYFIGAQITSISPTYLNTWLAFLQELNDNS